MEKNRIKRFYILACLLYLGVTILYGSASSFFFLSEGAGEWETEETGFLIYAYAIAISPVFYLYEFSLYRLRCAGLWPSTLHKGVSIAHNLWRIAMWTLILCASLLMLAWVMLGLR